MRERVYKKKLSYSAILFFGDFKKSLFPAQARDITRRSGVTRKWAVSEALPALFCLHPFESLKMNPAMINSTNSVSTARSKKPLTTRRVYFGT